MFVSPNISTRSMFVNKVRVMVKILFIMYMYMYKVMECRRFSRFVVSFVGCIG